MKKFILDLVEDVMNKADIHYGKFSRIDSKFDLKGRTAGQFVFYHCTPIVCGYYRFNLPMAEANGKEAFKETVIHEVAHYITKCVYGRDVKPHGKEWKSVAAKLGCDRVKVTHNYTIPSSARTMKYYDYKCDCMEHKISAVIHNKILKGQVRSCRRCKSEVYQVN